MRRISLYMIIAAMLIGSLLASCAEPETGFHEQGTVTIHIADDTPKLIGYDGTGAIGGASSINAFRVKVTRLSTGAAIESSWIMTPMDSWTISGLAVGEQYSFHAEGAIAMEDGSYALISSATETRNITENLADITISLAVLDTAEAESLAVTVSRPEKAEGSISISASMTDLSGSEIFSLSGSIEVDGLSTVITATKDQQDLIPGLYVMTVTAEDQAGGYWKASDAVRLLPGLPASGTISFTKEDGIDAEIGISDQMGHVIDFEGMPEEIEVPIGGTLRITVPYDSADADDQIWFYVNGTEVTDTVLPTRTESDAGYTYRIPTDLMVKGRNVLTIMVYNGLPYGGGSVQIACMLSPTSTDTQFSISDSLGGTVSLSFPLISGGGGDPIQDSQESFLMSDRLTITLQADQPTSYSWFLDGEPYTAAVSGTAYIIELSQGEHVVTLIGESENGILSSYTFRIDTRAVPDDLTITQISPDYSLNYNCSGSTWNLIINPASGKSWNGERAVVHYLLTNQNLANYATSHGYCLDSISTELSAEDHTVEITDTVGCTYLYAWLEVQGYGTSAVVRISWNGGGRNHSGGSN